MPTLRDVISRDLANESWSDGRCSRGVSGSRRSASGALKMPQCASGIDRRHLQPIDIRIIVWGMILLGVLAIDSDVHAQFFPSSSSVHSFVSGTTMLGTLLCPILARKGGKFEKFFKNPMAYRSHTPAGNHPQVITIFQQVECALISFGVSQLLQPLTVQPHCHNIHSTCLNKQVPDCVTSAPSASQDISSFVGLPPSPLPSRACSTLERMPPVAEGGTCATTRICWACRCTSRSMAC